jgi:hypothetical protein
MFAHPAVSITRKSTRQGGVLLGERTTRLYIFRAKVFLLERLAVAFVPVGVPEALGLPGTRRGWAGISPPPAWAVPTVVGRGTRGVPPSPPLGRACTGVDGPLWGACG